MAQKWDHWVSTPLLSDHDIHATDWSLEGGRMGAGVDIVQSAKIYAVGWGEAVNPGPHFEWKRGQVCKLPSA